MKVNGLALAFAAFYLLLVLALKSSAVGLDVTGAMQQLGGPQVAGEALEAAWQVPGATGKDSGAVGKVFFF